MREPKDMLMFFHDNRDPVSGFTMIELIIVISIISILLLFAIPSFYNTSPLQETKGQLADMVRLIEDLKKRAMEDRQVYFLHLDAPGSRLWVTDSSMDESAMEDAMEKATLFSDDFRLTGAAYQGQSAVVEECAIRFNPGGYSDFVIIYLVQDGNEMTIKVEPFLARARVLDGHVSHDDCT